MVAVREAEEAVICEAALWVTEGGLARVSKVSEGVAHDSPAKFVALAAKKKLDAGVRFEMFPEKFPLWVSGRASEEAQAPASISPSVGP